MFGVALLWMPRQPKARIPKCGGDRIPTLRVYKTSPFFYKARPTKLNLVQHHLSAFSTSTIRLLERDILRLHKSNQLESLGHRLGSDSSPIRSRFDPGLLLPTRKF